MKRNDVMEINYKNPIIILIAGKARSGKNTVAEMLKEMYELNNKKVIISPFTKYLKKYIEEITGEKIDENNKPRELLQQLGVEIIKEKLGKYDMFINREIDDIDIYSYFFDVIIIPDVRFPKEIEILKDKYQNVMTIKVISSLDNNMSLKERSHITETSLDNYDNDNFNYIIFNDDMDKLSDQINDIYQSIN